MLYEIGKRSPEVAEDVGFIADSAQVMGSVRLASGSSVWFNAVLRGDCDWIDIGENSNVQDGAILHTDPGIKLVVGEGVTIGHQAMLHGCSIGNNCLIGIGATILNGAVIGENCLIGAHALVTEGKVIPPGSMVVGSPAKVVKELSPAQIQMLKMSAAHYVNNARNFAKNFRPVNS